MRIISSAYTEGPAQADGRRWVRETHTAADGATYSYEWLGAQDAGAVLAARVAALDAQIAERDAAAAVVAGTKLPMTKYAFRQLFTLLERRAWDAFAVSFESDPRLTAEQRDAVRTGLADYREAQDIARPFVPEIVEMLGLLTQLGILTPERAAQIAEAGCG